MSRQGTVPCLDSKGTSQNYAKAGKLIIINKNKAQNTLATIGIHTAEVQEILNLVKINITQQLNISQEKNSYALSEAEDSEYMELAKEPEKNEERLNELVSKAARKAGL